MAWRCTGVDRHQQWMADCVMHPHRLACACGERYWFRAGDRCHPIESHAHQRAQGFPGAALATYGPKASRRCNLFCHLYCPRDAPDQSLCVSQCQCQAKVPAIGWGDQGEKLEVERFTCAYPGLGIMCAQRSAVSGAFIGGRQFPI